MSKELENWIKEGEQHQAKGQKFKAALVQQACDAIKLLNRLNGNGEASYSLRLGLQSIDLETGKVKPPEASKKTKN